ncbi:hypothetical protein [Romboutsia maritimum]|uniref:hypothetical protein n=1 Tax=Romboutsia maritimum TaxID=2020948 RepID=UPI000BA7455F|nr:hypothetical protein [Romboutsia maritimum]
MNIKKLVIIPFICILMLSGCSKASDNKAGKTINEVKDIIGEVKDKAIDLINIEKLEPIKLGITNSVDTVKESINEFKIDDVKSSVSGFTDKVLTSLKEVINKLSENKSYQGVKTEIQNLINKN